MSVREMTLKCCRVFEGYVAQATYEGPAAMDEMHVVDVAPQLMISGPWFQLLRRENPGSLGHNGQ